MVQSIPKAAGLALVLSPPNPPLTEDGGPKDGWGGIRRGHDSPAPEVPNVSIHIL